MADITYGNPAATDPKNQYINSLPNPGAPTTNLSNAAVYQAGYQPGTSTAIPSSSNLTTARNAYLDTFAPSSSVSSARESYLNSFAPTSALDAARQTYLNSLNPSTGLSTARQKYLDFQSAQDQGVNDIRNKPIASKFVTGQEAGLLRQNEATGRRLQGDISLAEQASLEAQNKAKFGLDIANQDFATGQNRAQAGLGFANEDFGFAQSKAQSNLGFATDDANKNAPFDLSAGQSKYQYNPATGKYEVVASQPANTSSSSNPQEFAIKNGITQPYYTIGNQIINTATGKPEYVNVNGEIRSVDGSKVYSSPEQFFADAGITSWNQIQNDVGTAQTKLLTPTEAKALGVPYGTTQQEAAALNITPTTKTGPITGTKVTLTQATNAADEDLRSAAGGDGYVSPEQFKQSRQEWTDLGMDVSTFYSKFKKYVNPADPQDYI